MANEKTDKDSRKQSLYFSEAMIADIKKEAARLDRSVSWCVQRAWMLAKDDIAKMASVDNLDDEG